MDEPRRRPAGADFRGTVGETAAVEIAAFLKVWRELPHPRAILNDPENADIPMNASALMALCGALYKLTSDVNFDAIVTYPDTEPAFPVLLCDYGDEASPWRHPAPWGEHIRIAA